MLPPRAFWPSLGHQMTPVVASRSEGIPTSPGGLHSSHLSLNMGGRKYPQGSTDAVESHKMASS